MTQNPFDLVSLECRIQRLEDIEAIKGVISRYAEGADRQNDPAMMGPLFAVDAIWEAPGFGRYEGRDTIVESLASIARNRIVWSVHFMILPTVSVLPGERNAACTWYLWELAKIHADGETARDTWLAIKYDSTLLKNASGWLFKSLKLNLLLNCPVSVPWPMPVRNSV